jgi:hypothetical protein
LFTVSAVPDATAEQEAIASIGYSPGERRAVRTSLDCDAFPAGQGLHRGAFYLGSETDLLRIDTAPDAGQNFGDPITVAFTYSYTSLLQNFDDYPPLNPAYVEWHGFLDAGDATQPLFDGLFSTDFTPGDEVHDGGLIQINMNVGDTIAVHLRSDGEAYASEPHSKDRVAFSADFVVQDFTGNAPALATLRTALFPLLGLDQHQEQSWGGSTGTAGSTGRTSHGINPQDLDWAQGGQVFEGASPENTRHAPGPKLALSPGVAVLLAGLPQQDLDPFSAFS